MSNASGVASTLRRNGRPTLPSTVRWRRDGINLVNMRDGWVKLIASVVGDTGAERALIDESVEILERMGYSVIRDSVSEARVFKAPRNGGRR